MQFAQSHLELRAPPTKEETGASKRVSDTLILVGRFGTYPDTD